MTIDDVRAAAEKARAWRPKVCERVFDQTNGEMAPCHGCDSCLGAKRAVEDISEMVDDAVRNAMNYAVHPDRSWSLAAILDASRASSIASYFASEPNQVSESRDAVLKFVEAGK